VGRGRRRQGGDDAQEQELRALVAEHGSWLASFCLRLTAGDRPAAEDLMQETLVRAWRHPEALDGHGGSARAWLATVARNLAVDRGRRQRRRPREVGLEGLGGGPGGEGVRGAAAGRLDPGFPALDEADQLVEAAVVAAAVERLSAAHREVLQQVVVEGRPVAEVARTLGVPVGTVKSRVYYGLRSLRLALEELAWPI
jgi:RNA polymerase sigma-70 factor (ECF subfamily)